MVQHTDIHIYCLGVIHQRAVGRVVGCCCLDAQEQEGLRSRRCLYFAVVSLVQLRLFNLLAIVCE
jgi:hypothetical protein